MNDEVLDQFEDYLFLNEGDDHEVVAKFYSPLEGEMAAARLRSEGIPCFLANANSQSIMPHLQLVARLHVRPQDMEIAREILGEAAIDTAEAEGSNEPIRWGLVIGIIGAIMLGITLAKYLITMLVEGRL